MEAWLGDTQRLVSTEDCGRDEASVEALLKKHAQVQKEVKEFVTQIQALKDQVRDCTMEMIDFLD